MRPWVAILALACVLACEKTPAEPTGNTATTSTASPTQSAASTAATATATPPASAGAPSTTTPKIAASTLDPARGGEQAPAIYKAKFATSKGDFVIEVHKDWAPIGANRFYNLVKMGYYNDQRFFRAVEGFMVQWGIHGDPAVSAKWRNASISDDNNGGQSNKRGFVTFAKAGPDSRTTQVFISYGDNARLDAMGFPPFGRVVQGMEVVDSLYKGYGDGPPGGTGPNQGLVQSRGNAYLSESFPKLDFIKEATIVP